MTECVEFEGAMALDDFRRGTGVKMMKYDEGERRRRERILLGNGWEMRVRILEFLRKSRCFRYCGKYPRGFKGKERSQASLI